MNRPCAEDGGRHPAPQPHKGTPSWQTSPCPPWCVSIHREGDTPGDRHCLSRESLLGDLLINLQAEPGHTADIVVALPGASVTMPPEQALRAGFELVMSALTANGTWV